MAKNNDYNIGDNQELNQPQGGTGRGMGGGRAVISGSAEKAKDFKKIFGKLIVYMQPYLAAIMIALILAVIGTVFHIIGPAQLGNITNLITEGMDAGTDLGAVGRIGLLLAILYSLGFLFNYLQGFILATVTQRVSKKMRTDITQKINRLPLKYFDGASYGDILSRVTNDVDTIGQTLNQSTSSLITAVTMFAGSLFMMLYINIIMALTAVVSSLIGFTLMMVIMAKSQKYFVAQQQELGKINGHIEEIYAGHHVVKVYNGEKQARETMHTINEKLYESAWKSQFMSGIMQPLMNFIGNFGYVAVCVAGAMLAMNGSVTFGVIVAFMIYVRLFTQPLSQMAQAATNLQSAAAAGERVFEFLEEVELTDESAKTTVLTEVNGNVEFANVSFGYNKDKTIIHNFSASIKAGQKIAIVGPTGAGKTTIVNLLMGFYEVDRGEIKIDGVPLPALTRENIHQLFCMVLQDTWMFEGTVTENIAYNKNDVTDEQIITACKAAGVDHFVRTLPQGYDTILDDKANLSAGQKQLITIARAMVKNAPMLILDEATSSVDTRTEVLIQDAMDRLMAGRTSFVIAHRLSTIKNADLILVMKDGDIIESGNHEELLAKNGFYAELYNSQFEGVA